MSVASADGAEEEDASLPFSDLSRFLRWEGVVEKERVQDGGARAVLIGEKRRGPLCAWRCRRAGCEDGELGVLVSLRKLDEGVGWRTRFGVCGWQHAECVEAGRLALLELEALREGN